MEYQTYMHSIKSGAIDCPLKPSEIRNFTKDDFEIAKTLYYGFADYRNQVSKPSSETQTSNSETDTDYDDDDVQLIEIVPKRRKFNQMDSGPRKNRTNQERILVNERISQDDDDHVEEAQVGATKKGINSFLLFSKVHRPIACELNKIQNRDISKILSEWWNCNSLEWVQQKQAYIDFAAEIRGRENNESLKEQIDKALRTFPRFDCSNYEPKAKLSLNANQIEEVIASYREKQNPNRMKAVMAGEVAEQANESNARTNIDQQRRFILKLFNKKLFFEGEDIEELQEQNEDLFPDFESLRNSIRDVRRKLMNMRLL